MMTVIPGGFHQSLYQSSAVSVSFFIKFTHSSFTVPLMSQ
jgi:hypothetical protein